MVETDAPRPRWLGLVPPKSVLGAAPPASVTYDCGLNKARLALNATVFTLAMLLPTTFIRVWLTSRPESPVNSALVIAILCAPRPPLVQPIVNPQNPRGQGTSCAPQLAPRHTI